MVWQGVGDRLRSSRPRPVPLWRRPRPHIKQLLFAYTFNIGLFVYAIMNYSVLNIMMVGPMTVLYILFLIWNIKVVIEEDKKGDRFIPSLVTVQADPDRLRVCHGQCVVVAVCSSLVEWHSRDVCHVLCCGLSQTLAKLEVLVRRHPHD